MHFLIHVNFSQMKDIELQNYNHYAIRAFTDIFITIISFASQITMKTIIQSIITCERVLTVYLLEGKRWMFPFIVNIHTNR